MDRATIEMKPHERGAEVDLDVQGLSFRERLGVIMASVLTLFSGRMHVHLIHALVRARKAESVSVDRVG